MIICKNVGFIHIPRTGGTSIRQALFDQPSPAYTVGCITKPTEDVRAPGNLYNPHCPIDMYLDLPCITRLDVFTIVRNPWDRYVSWYLYSTRNPENTRTFSEFMETVFENAPTSRNPKVPRNPVTQSEYLNFNRLKMLRFEQLGRNWTKFCTTHELKVNKLPRLSSTESHTCREFYTPKWVQVVAEREAKVIELLGYRYPE